MPADRQFYNPEGGMALDKDNEIFDVTAWRKNGNQERNGQEHHRVYDPTAATTLCLILAELKKMNTHLEIITGESI